MKKGLWVVAVLIFALGSVNLARADQFFQTTAGAVDTAGDPVAATANFSLSGTTLTLTLINTQTGMKDVGQALTDIFFTLSSGTATLSSQAGQLINVAADGSITNIAGTPAWGFGAATVNSINGFEACVICQGGPTSSATPSEGILGPVSGDGKYDNANSSIAANGPHNPFIDQNGLILKFTVGSGVTVDNVLFSFGTTPGDNVGVPEPASLSLLGAGLLGLGIKLRRRSKRA